MSSTILKYLLVFLFGGMTGYLILYTSEKDVSPQTVQDSSLTMKPADSNKILSDNTSITNTKNTIEIESDIFCEEQTKHIEKQYTESALTPTQLINEAYAQLTEVVKENQILKYKLEMLEPSNVTDDDLKELVPAPYNLSLNVLEPKLKQDISDFHKQEPDLDWGYRKQQQLTDFITTHINSQYIKLASINCKIEKCEIIIDELITKESMMRQGLDDNEIQSITDTQQPKYKQIFDDMLTTPALNMRPELYMPNRFGIYMLIKEKTGDN